MPGEDPETLPLPSTVAPKLIDMIAPDFAANGMRYDVKTGKLQAL